MKDITFTVPCYNSQEYLERCVESLLAGGADVEIIIVDDGSTDRTGELADRYQVLYPGIVRAVHQPNGGHGAAVNRGLSLAKGFYFKVVDSDDWLDEGAYPQLLERVRRFRQQGVCPDLLICNYIYDHLDQGTGKRMDYRNVFPEGRICGWEELKCFHPSQYLIMHAQIFRTQLLREAEVVLPEHTFYVDNLFSCKPLPLVKKICYLDLDLYHYYLGREDQSVNEKVMISRIDQLTRVTELVAGCMDLDEVKKSSPRLASYLKRNISIMMTITSIHMLLMKSREGLEMRKTLWKKLKRDHRKLYYQLRYRNLSGAAYLPGRLGRAVTLSGYRLAKKYYQFQ